jgi:hypothetical protein
MGLIIEISSIVMQWTGVFESVDIATCTLANRVIFRQQNRLIYQFFTTSTTVQCHAVLTENVI